MDQRELLLRYFFNRIDAVAVLAHWGKPCPVDAVGKLEQLIDGHIHGSTAGRFVVYRLDDGHRKDQLQGPFRIGTYAPDSDGKTIWVGIDIDGAGHSHAVADPKAVAYQIKAQCDALGIPAYVELSGGGHGWHVWTLFENPILAAKARQFALLLVPPDVALANGGIADATKSKGIEIFPKQDRIAEDGFGNFMWLPLWHSATGAANQFHQLQNGSGLQPYIPQSFETVTEATVDRILVDSRPPQDSPKNQDSGATKSKHAEVWQQWRKSAVAALPPERVYSDLLTGKKKNEGWLECRDPNSESGDKHPSAGVADGTGKAERCAFHSFISGETKSVFDFLIDEKRATDFKDACRIVADLSGVPLPTGDPPSQSAGKLPVIFVNARQFRDVLDDAWTAVLQANNPEPTLFARENALVRIVDTSEVPYIEHLKEPVVFEHIARAADWIRIKGTIEIEVPPPKDISRVMHAKPHSELPQLEGLRTTPFFSSAGSLIDIDGYHETEKIWLRSDGLAGIPSIISFPSQSQVQSACALLREDLLGEFPFVADSDLAHILAAFIQTFVRRLIYGPTPLHVIEAPIAGSGKGLLCELISLCAVGTPIEARTMPEKDSEARKMITAELSRGRPIILFDNIRDRTLLDSPPLASVLTILTWTDRVMGETRMISVPNRALWLLTGNNVRLSTELARRSLRIRIDPRMDQPWKRSFRHANLRDWATNNRPRLVSAVLQIVQAWIAEGRPLSGNHLGSFENWSAVLGGILEVARVPGFLGNLESFYQATDAQGEPWREFTAKWWEAFGIEPKRITELNAFCNTNDLLVGVRGDKTDRSQATRLGFALQNARDRVYGRFRIDQVSDDSHKGRTYKLTQVEVSECSAGTSGTFDQTSPSTSPTPDELSGNELCDRRGRWGPF